MIRLLPGSQHIYGDIHECLLDGFSLLTILLRVRITVNMTAVAEKNRDRSDRQKTFRGQAGSQHHRIDIHMLCPGSGFLVKRIQPKGLNFFDQRQNHGSIVSKNIRERQGN